MRFPFFAKTESDSINQKIFRAAVIIGLLTLVTRVGTIVKELAVARTFGRSDAMDAFLIAFLLPSFFVTLVMGAAGSALVPVFVATRPILTPSPSPVSGTYILGAHVHFV